MGDIVERLRAADCAGFVVPMMNEAADEIERLRGALRGIRLVMTDNFVFLRWHGD